MSRKHAGKTRNGLKAPRSKRAAWQRRGVAAGQKQREAASKAAG